MQEVTGSSPVSPTKIRDLSAKVDVTERVVSIVADRSDRSHVGGRAGAGGRQQTRASSFAPLGTVARVTFRRLVRQVGVQLVGLSRRNASACENRGSFEPSPVASAGRCCPGDRVWRSHCCGTYRGADADCIADSDSGPGTHIRADADRGATSNASSDARSDRNTRSDAGTNGDAGRPSRLLRRSRLRRRHYQRRRPRRALNRRHHRIRPMSSPPECRCWVAGRLASFRVR